MGLFPPIEKTLWATSNLALGGKKIQKAKFWVILQFSPYPLLLFISYNYICSFTKIPIGTAEIAQTCIQIFYLPFTSWVTLSKLPNLSESQFFFSQKQSNGNFFVEHGEGER